MLVEHARLRSLGLAYARLLDAFGAFNHYPTAQTLLRRQHATNLQPAEAATSEEPVKRKRRTSKRAASPKTEKQSSISSPAASLPARLVTPVSQHHHDVESYHKYAAAKKLNKRSNVYRGTLYEYTVAATLQPFGLHLHRVGRSNDLGIDLVGHWSLPDAQELKVLAQCKATAPQPSMVRELAGASAGAPAGWRGNNVLAMLICSKPFTKGAREAMQRSSIPVALSQVDARGRVKQLIWNTAAEYNGLAGLGVTTRYATNADGQGDEAVVERGSRGRSQSERGTIALTWMGGLWRADHPTEP